MKTYIRLLVVLLIVTRFIGCKSGSLAPVDQTARETELINSVYPAESLTGTYRVVQAYYKNPDLYEGEYTYGVPDPRFMTSEYYLDLFPNKAKDSLYVVVYGDGKLGKIDRDTLKAVGMVSNSGITANTAGYYYTFWEWGTKADTVQATASRRAFSDKTNLLVSINLARYLDANGNLTGKPVFEIDDFIDPPYGRPARQKTIAVFTGTLSSSGILKITK